MEPIFRTNFGVQYRGDCLTVLPGIADASVHCVFADPPFSVGKDYGPAVNDRLPDHDYYTWAASWIREAHRVLVPGGSLFIHNLPRHLVVLGSWAITSASLEFEWVTWIAVRECRRPPIGGRLYPDHMGVLWLSKGPIRTFHRLRVPIATCRRCGGEIPDHGGKRGQVHPDGTTLGEVWTDSGGVFHRKHKDPSRVGGGHNPSRRGNQLPISIPERCILSSTDPGDTVLDPFMGSGTTAEGCERHGRRWVGIEIGDVEPIRRRASNLREVS